MPRVARRFFPVRHYHLGLTLTSGQVFRWRDRAGGWEGVIGGRWVRLEQDPDGLAAWGMSPVGDWRWLRHFLQLDIDYQAVLRTFPQDEVFARALNVCRGLRLLRQDPWECLASFILSSTKRVVQIEGIVNSLCERFGSRLSLPPGRGEAYRFPGAEAMACLSERELRGCGMGFRAPYLLEVSRLIAGGVFDLDALQGLPRDEALTALTALPGVGSKIGNCVLLFGYGVPGAFPIDVWIDRALRRLYFPKGTPSSERLKAFVSDYFGPFGGFAQQFLFHFMRTGGAGSDRPSSATRRRVRREPEAAARDRAEGKP